MGWVGLALGAMICWALWAVLAKASGMDWRALSFWSLAIQGVLACLLLFGGPVAWAGRSTILAVLAGVGAFSGTLLFYAALRQGPSAAVVPLTLLLYPALAVVLSATLLHEPVTYRQVAGLAAALVAGFLLASE